MTGAEAILRTAAAAGIDVCFANPGTTEMALVSALDAVPAVRAVLGLFEGVCSGAADGYARMTGRPALTVLHLGPGLGNAIANLHNARRACSPVVNLVGDQATWHRDADAPLTSDIASLARNVSRWVRETKQAQQIAQDAADAITAALEPPGGVATLIAPADCLSGDAPASVQPRKPAGRRRVAADRIGSVAKAVREGSATLFLGGTGLSARALRAAGRVARAASCRLVCETFPARWERGAGLPVVERLPYFPEPAMATLEGAKTLVLAGAPEPVAFFGYPGVPSRLTPQGCTLTALATREEDVEGALESLAEALGAPAFARGPAAERPQMPQGALSAEAAATVLALLQPEDAIVVDEANTSGLGYVELAAGAPRHSLLTLTGGAIGMGPACAAGAALACRDRTVIDFQADGSAMYTLQALWTQAREQLHVITLLCSNRAYRILQFEAMRAGVTEPGPQSTALTDLSRPPLDWVQLARGLGVSGTRVDTAEELRHALERALGEPGPHLIELVL